jgi:hypothetical protein
MFGKRLLISIDKYNRKKMKTTIFWAIILVSTTCFAQRVRGFTGFGIYLNRSFEKSGFASFNGGLEFKLNRIIKPEIQFEYFFGSLTDRTTEDSNGIKTELLVRSVSATNLSICSKINIGDIETPVLFQILPIFNITNSTAKGSKFNQNNTNTNLIKTDTDSFSEKRYSFGLGVGIVFNLSEERSQAIALNLYYNNIDIGNALNNLKFNQGIYQTQQSLGIGMKYYFGFVKHKKKSF